MLLDMLQSLRLPIQSVGFWGYPQGFGELTCEIVAVVKPAIIGNFRNGVMGVLQQNACPLQAEPFKVGHGCCLIVRLK